MSSNPTPSLEPAAPTLSATEVWLEKNFKKVVVLCVAAIVAAALYGVIRYRTEAVAHQAALAFTGADTVEGFDAVVSQFPGSVAAGNALLAKADLLWEKNQKDSSTEVLSKFLADFSNHPLAAETKLALASRLEEMGEKDKAKQFYEEIISQNAESHLAPLAEIRLGDLLWEGGKTDEAKEIYSALPSKYPGTNQPFFDQSQDRLKWIGAALPTKEVDAPKPPPAPEAPAAPAAAATPGAITLPPMNLGAGQNAPGMNVTVTPEGGVVTPPVKVEPMPATPPAPATEAPAKPATTPATEPPTPAPPAPATETPAKPATPPAPVPPAAATGTPAEPTPADAPPVPEAKP